MVNNKWWRPSKIKTFIEAFQEVISYNAFDVVILTDEELLIECNERLEDKQKISDRTFQRWKAGQEESEEYLEFCRLYKKALIAQKRNLFISLRADSDKWQKYAWIIERKFNEWNLKKIVDNNIEVKDYTFVTNLDE